MAVQTSSALKNKRVKLLDGTRVKIIGVLSASYKLEDGSKLPARKVLQKGKSYVETEMTMRDLEDSGMGFVVIPEAEADTKKSKSKSKSKAKDDSKKSKTKTKGRSKTKAKSKDEDDSKKSKTKTKGRSKTKAKDEADTKKSKTKGRSKTRAKDEPVETKTKGRKKKSKKSQDSSGTKQSEKSTAVESKIKRVDLDFSTKTQIDKIRQLVSNELREHLVTYHSNIENIISEASIFKDDEDRAEIRLQVLVKVPRPAHHSLEFYLAIAKEQGANLKTPSEKLQVKMRERLDLDESEEPVEISVGSVLDDEQGKRYVFAGILDKKFAFVDLENSQVVTGAYTFFEGLDYIADFDAVMGEGMEEFDQRKTQLDSSDPDIEDAWDIEDLEPLSSIEDWTTVERDSMVDMIVGNYSREDIISFIEQHEDLELEEDEYDLETNVIVGMMVDALRSDSEEFEEDEEPVEEELTVEKMLEVLVEKQLVPASLAKHLTEEQVEAMYADLENEDQDYTVDLEEAETLEEADDDGLEDELDNGEVEDDDGLEDELDDGEVEDDEDLEDEDDIEVEDDEDLEDEDEDEDEDVSYDSLKEELAALGIKGITPRVLANMDEDAIQDLANELSEELAEARAEYEEESDEDEDEEVEGDEIIEDEDDLDFDLEDQ